MNGHICQRCGSIVEFYDVATAEELGDGVRCYDCERDLFVKIVSRKHTD